MGKVVLITGASRGIGKSLAERLVRSGYSVFGTARNKASLTLAGVVPLSLDVTSQDSFNEAIQDIIDAKGRIDVLVNNAGFGVVGPSECTSIEQAKALFDVNVFGVMRGVKAVAPHMRAQGGGRIVNMSSLAGIAPAGLLPVYGATKFAVQALSGSDAMHLSEWNIFVSTVLPGAVATGFAEEIPLGDFFTDENNPYKTKMQEDRKIVQDLLQEGQAPEEVAAVIQKAIEDKEPKFWYPTSDYGKRLIEAYYKDPSGLSFIPPRKI